MSRVADDTDTFGGVAATALPTYDTKWNLGPYANNCEISTPVNGYAGSVGGNAGDYNSKVAWANDQYAKATVGPQIPGTRWLIGVRTSTAAFSGYYGGATPGISNNKYRIVRYDVGVLTSLAADAATAITAADVVILEVSGTVLSLYVNNLVVALLTYDTAGDATKYASGSPAMSLQDSVTNGLQSLTTWEAGHFSSVAAGGATTTTIRRARR